MTQNGLNHILNMFLKSLTKTNHDPFSHKMLVTLLVTILVTVSVSHTLSHTPENNSHNISQIVSHTLQKCKSKCYMHPPKMLVTILFASSKNVRHNVSQ